MRLDIKQMHALHKATDELVKAKCGALCNERDDRNFTRVQLMLIDTNDSDVHWELRLDGDLVGHIMALDKDLYEYMAEHRLGSATCRHDAVLHLLEHHIMRGPQ